jgi:NADPH:quinone reductase-like Zn-dependent oxidoreductase
VAYVNFGTPYEVLEMVESPVPRFRSWEVVVEVAAAAINPVDYKMIGGAFFLVKKTSC